MIPNVDLVVVVLLFSQLSAFLRSTDCAGLQFSIMDRSRLIRGRFKVDLKFCRIADVDTRYLEPRSAKGCKNCFIPLQYYHYNTTTTKEIKNIR